MPLILPAVLLIAALQSEPLGYDSNPLGVLEKPLILRTYVPDPGLDPAVLSHHGQAAKSPKYNAGKGRDVAGEYEMIKVLPAAIAVNHGPALSYVFDTIECRVMYAWQGGFLDMYPYWGDTEKGGRRSFDYVPRLVGNLFYLAQPQEQAEPRFIGYDLSENGVPTFRYRLGEQEFAETILPSEEKLTFQRVITTQGQKTTEDISGELLSRHQGFDREIKIADANAKAGEEVFLAYGCIACHSTDGSVGHGPTLAGLFGSKREIEGGDTITADEAYLRESILAPNAKTAKGFPPNYMPPYQLNEKELDSVILFIKSSAEVTRD
ncbi:cytochrome c [Roseibacillus persicicus]|uniref:c-type cytochrome n=1 Tax=Roseibacillus persicicus TaxID=454148 RepID=UPI00398B2FA1